MGFAALEIHPGYQLHIQTFGQLKLWLGKKEPVNEIPEKAWSRKRALQLFLLFLSHRDQMLHREQICDILWPDAAYDESVRDFKIAYSAMCSVLEPHRRPHAPSSFIVRTGLRYGLRPEADIWLDSAEFERLIAEGDRQWGKDDAEAVRCYRTAVQLYQGNYLQAYLYDAWLSAERDRLLALYLRTAERLAQLLVNQQLWQEAADVCHAILARDNSWEAAYRLLMQIYAAQGNWTFALQIYDRCQQTLRDQWGMIPAPETVALYEQIRQRRAVNE
jgi:DNA-binding SARP family transcriptional activator